MWVKICGQTSPEGVRAAVEHGADALGFIFVDGVRRQRSPADVAAWTADVPAHVQRVGVFMDQPLEVILDAARTAGLTAVQLHGQEPPELVAQLQAAGYRVVKAVKIAAAADLAQLERYAVADALLLEPKVPGEKGGAGVALDLSLAAQAVARARAVRAATAAARTRALAPGQSLPPTAPPDGLPTVILAGGLTPESVAAAVQATGALAVDVSSGVETAGAKDPVRIAAFIQVARLARRNVEG